MFKNISSPIKVQCNICKYEWSIGYVSLMKKIPDCPKCKPKTTARKKNVMSEEERVKFRSDRYYQKILQKSNHMIEAANYIGSKDEVDVRCVICGHRWKSRADHLVDRCWCPVCKKKIFRLVNRIVIK